MKLVIEDAAKRKRVISSIHDSSHMAAPLPDKYVIGVAKFIYSVSEYVTLHCRSFT